MIVRMTKAIGNQFFREEMAKVSQENGKSPIKTYQPVVGDTVLVHFPDGNDSKLIPNWKGVYKVKEQIDKNTFIVSLEGNERKKYIVHRSRIRNLQGLQSTVNETDNFGAQQTTDVKNQSFKRLEQNQSKPLEKSIIPSNHEPSDQKARKVRRSAAKAALARMKNMR